MVNNLLLGGLHRTKLHLDKLFRTISLPELVPEWSLIPLLGAVEHSSQLLLLFRDSFCIDLLLRVIGRRGLA